MRSTGLAVDANESDFVGVKSKKKPLHTLLQQIVGNHAQFPNDKLKAATIKVDIESKEIILSSATIRLLYE